MKDSDLSLSHRLLLASLHKEGVDVVALAFDRPLFIVSGGLNPAHLKQVKPHMQALQLRLDGGGLGEPSGELYLKIQEISAALLLRGFKALLEPGQDLAVEAAPIG